MEASEDSQPVKQHKDEPPKAPAPATPEIQYPGFMLASILYLGLLLAMFLVALDMSIIATAIPTITKTFHDVDQVGWYGSAFFMTLAAFQSFWGKAYKYFPLKVVFLLCIGLFEIGSLIVAVAENSVTVIAGRAVQGLGGAGVTGGCYTICAFITRPNLLATMLGLFSTVWSCSSVLGPVLGGVFTQDVTWRWCFWVNLPIGGTTMIIILLFFKTPPHSRIASTTWKELPLLFDLPGITILLGSLICLLVALEDGGVTKPWNNSVPIGTLIGFGLLAILFVFVEWKQGEQAMIVPRIMKRRTIYTLALFNLCAQGGGFARTYNLPEYFQAAQGVSASESGIRTLPTVLTVSIFSLAGSILLGKVGYYQPFLWIGAIFMTVGAGMIYTLVPSSPAAHYIGYQVLAGIGTGLVIQLPVIVGQAISQRSDMAVTIALSLFYQFIGGTVGVSVAQNIQNHVLINSLPTDNPNITAAKVMAAGSTGLRLNFPDPADLQIVVNAYMDGLRAAWIWTIALSGLAFLISFTTEWKSIKPEDVKKRSEKKATEEGVV